MDKNEILFTINTVIMYVNNADGGYAEVIDKTYQGLGDEDYRKEKIEILYTKGFAHFFRHLDKKRQLNLLDTALEWNKNRDQF